MSSEQVPGPLKEDDDEPWSEAAEVAPIQRPLWAATLLLLIASMALAPLALASEYWAHESIQVTDEEDFMIWRVGVGLWSVDWQWQDLWLYWIFGPMDIDEEYTWQEYAELTDDGDGLIPASDEWARSGVVTGWLMISGLVLLGLAAFTHLQRLAREQRGLRQVGLWLTWAGAALLVMAPLGWLVLSPDMVSDPLTVERVEDAQRTGLDPGAHTLRLGPSWWLAMLAGALATGAAVATTLMTRDAWDEAADVAGRALRFTPFTMDARPTVGLAALVSSGCGLLLLLQALLIALVDPMGLTSESIQQASADEEDDGGRATWLVQYAREEQIDRVVSDTWSDGQTQSYEHQPDAHVENLSITRYLIACDDDSGATGDQNPGDGMDQLTVIIEHPAIEGGSTSQTFDCDGTQHELAWGTWQMPERRYVEGEEALAEVLNGSYADPWLNGSWQVTLELETHGSLGGTGQNRDGAADIRLSQGAGGYHATW